jgi:uncharacterized membrane protein YciS (DUF1049 family)
MMLAFIYACGVICGWCLCRLYYLWKNMPGGEK